MKNKYVPAKDCNGNINWKEPYIKNLEIKRMPLPYSKRVDYMRAYMKEYRKTHKEQMKEYQRRWEQKQKEKKIKILEEVLGDKLNKDNVVSRIR